MRSLWYSLQSLQRSGGNVKIGIKRSVDGWRDSCPERGAPSWSNGLIHASGPRRSNESRPRRASLSGVTDNRDGRAAGPLTPIFHESA